MLLALGYGVHLVNRAAVAEVAASVRELAGEADLHVRGGRGGFPESLYPKVARVPGVAWVKPGLELEAGIDGTRLAAGSRTASTRRRRSRWSSASNISSTSRAATRISLRKSRMHCICLRTSSFASACGRKRCG